jgi:hypothetical protein
MSRQFSTIIEDTRLAWDVKRLWLDFKTLESVDWVIPDLFKDSWSWGTSHPSEHLIRCLNANLSFPILVWDGFIIDGCHRTVKSLALGRKTIKAKIITNIPPPHHQSDIISCESNHDIVWTMKDMTKLVKVFIEYSEFKSH